MKNKILIFIIFLLTTVSVNAQKVFESPYFQNQTQGDFAQAHVLEVQLHESKTIVKVKITAKRSIAAKFTEPGQINALRLVSGGKTYLLKEQVISKINLNIGESSDLVLTFEPLSAGVTIFDLTDGTFAINGIDLNKKDTYVSTALNNTVKSNVVKIEDGNLTILKNNEHYIHYNISGSNINIYVEDLKDYDLNLDIQYVERNWGCATINGKYKEYYSDGCKLEFDIDQDGKLTMSDMGYYKISKSKKAGAHFLPEFNGGIQFGFYNDRAFTNGPAFIDETKSDCSYSIRNGHLVYVFTIPFEEVLVQENYKMMFRVMIDRTAAKPVPNIEYKEFFYPEGQTRDYLKTSSFFMIDLTNSTNIDVLAYKDKRKNQIVEKKVIKSDARLLRKLYTKEAIKKALKTPPVLDGLYIETKSGLFIEVPYQTCNYGLLLENKIRLITDYSRLNKKVKNPYFIEECFDTLRFIQIEQKEFNALRMVAGGKLKKSVDYFTVHNINRYPLKPLPGGNFYLYKAPESSDEYHSGEVSNTYIYWFENPKIETYSEPAESWSYKFTLKTPVEVNHIYGAWALENIWLFEIIQDKPVIQKQVQTKKTNSRSTK